MSANSIAALTIVGYEIIEIDENDGDLDVEQRLSQPQTVLGLLIEKYDHFSKVKPVTTEGVIDSNNYALVRPDGKIEHHNCGVRILNSLRELKLTLAEETAELYRELAVDAAKSGEEKDAKLFRQISRKNLRRIEELS